MISVRISKYNPIHRDINGYYLKHEWISYYDIGKRFPDGILTEDAYLNIENKYLYVVKVLFHVMPIATFRIKDLEVYNRKYKKVLREGEQIPENRINTIVRLIMREMFWCKLVNEYVEVHFGYDYYIFIVFKKGYTVRKIIDYFKIVRAVGLYRENKGPIYYL